MEAATDQNHPAEPAQASSPTTHGGRGPQSYRQDPGSILLVATPIGDVRDASPRVVEALQGADIVAAEDTRRARALASRLGIKLGGRLIALHDHNEAEKAASIVEAARGGARVVFVSDAGMPTVSDPGFRLACAAIDAGVPLSVLPGPSAPLVALALSGLPSDRFAFEGFLPRKDGEATRYLQDLATDPHTLIFFESPRRAAATLTRMAEVLGGDRRAALCRELTKDYEEVRRGTLGELAEGADSILGEVTIVVAGYERSARAEDHVGAVLALAAEGMRLKDAAAEVAAATGARKNDLYKAALAAK
ncbi:16S rRNA (cytidine(1402)-2'-O)-methyltransferase [Actinomyces sp. ICM47]|uniref:16S rRNA (cytidine(1402)-2'-O)-methyltransferase n=1 Tax=Actinomyces sp. ICM47 TaxID=936548 RepID=UPI0002733289|nr:16S rRNA (cytidine(1402)-2'-O)-methyltransferase [Actinomyces sp. ICM47]EJG15257.1 S-adenosylmethionine-dependent methyltransferase, YraL family [Actinomyces sp. ICM47]